MKSRKNNILAIICTLFVALGAISCSGTQDQERGEENALAKIPEEKISSRKAIQTRNGTYTSIKYTDENGRTQEIIVDEHGRKVNPDKVRLEFNQKPTVGEELESFLEETPKELLEVPVTCWITFKRTVEEPVAGSSEFSTNKEGEATYYVNGKQVTKTEYDAFQNEQTKARENWQKQLTEEKERNIRLLNTREKLNISESDIEAFVDSNKPYEITLPAKEIKEFTRRNSDIIFHIDLKVEAQTS